MVNKKWLAINLRAQVGLDDREDLLLMLFEEIISKFKEKVDSWHFLWESDPYPNTLLLRFYGDSEVIDKIKENFDGFLQEKKIDFTPDNTYDGEAKSYGAEGWKYVMRILHLGSTLALDLAKNERTGGKKEEFAQPILCYVDRWIHLFLNQLLTRRIVEHDVLFKFSVHRYIISKIGAKNYQEMSKEKKTALVKMTPDFSNVLTEKVDDFLRDIGYNI